MGVTQVRNWAGTSLLALLVAAGGYGCAPAPVSEPPPEPKAGDDIRLGVESPQVMALWQDAEVARQTRDYARATVRLEQAIRMEPGNPILWSRLAELRLLQNEPGQAENLAAKSNALSASNPSLRYRNWLIIRHAREARSDQEGVDLAQRELDKLQDSAGE
jgi:predicted Zn-dependent protease